MLKKDHDMSSEIIEIPLSKRKLLKSLAACLLLFAGSAWILIFQPTTSNALFNSPLIKYGASSAGALLFGFGLILFTIKLFRGGKGLLIDVNGITDDSSLTGAGFVPWSEITHIVTTRVAKQEFLILMVKNPESYIERETNFLKRKTMQANYKHYFSPISITDKSLQTTLPELRDLLESHWKAYKQGVSQ
jgi:hypothetical protein